MSAPKVPVLLWILEFYIVKKQTKKRARSLISANITNDKQVVFVFHIFPFDFFDVPIS